MHLAPAKVLVTTRAPPSRLQILGFRQTGISSIKYSLMWEVHGIRHVRGKQGRTNKVRCELFCLACSSKHSTRSVILGNANQSRARSDLAGSVLVSGHDCELPLIVDMELTAHEGAKGGKVAHQDYK